MSKIRILTALFFLLFISSCEDSTEDETTNPDIIVEDFFNILKTEGSDSALNYFFYANNYFEEDTAKLNYIKTTFTLYNQKLGYYRGYEMLSIKHIGGNYVIYSVLARFDRQPIRFIFSFYKATETWMPFKLNFDDKIEVNEPSKIH